MKKKNQQTEEEIDELVISQADDDNAWEEFVTVDRELPITLSLPPELASRAAFFAQLHKMPVAAWLQRIVQERLAFEESAFAGLKQVMEEKSTYKTS